MFLQTVRLYVFCSFVLIFEKARKGAQKIYSGFSSLTIKGSLQALGSAQAPLRTLNKGATGYHRKNNHKNFLK